MKNSSYAETERSTGEQGTVLLAQGFGAEVSKFLELERGLFQN